MREALLFDSFRFPELSAMSSSLACHYCRSNKNALDKINWKSKSIPYWGLILLYFGLSSKHRRLKTPHTHVHENTHTHTWRKLRLLVNRRLISEQWGGEYRWQQYWLKTCRVCLLLSSEPSSCRADFIEPPFYAWLHIMRGVQHAIKRAKETQCVYFFALHSFIMTRH